jgi:BTB/POZ domain-containing protein KCTD1/15
MVKQIEQMKKERLRNGCTALSQNSSAPAGGNHSKFTTRFSPGGSYEVIALHISPDLGERILLSADRSILDEVFPETNQAILDARSGVAWNQYEGRQVIRFPLNGYCKLNSIQVLTRLLNAGFTVEASTGGGAESQQFSEYLLVRKHLM